MNRAFGFGLVLLALGAGALLAPSAGAAARSFAGAPAPAGHGGPSPGYLGVDLRDVSDDQANLHPRESRGAEIVLVDHDAPAGKAGLREHDIVLRINGQPILSQDQARHILHDCPPASPVVLTIVRESQLLTVTARMSTREEVERQAWTQHVIPPSQGDAPSELGNSASTSPGPAPSSGVFHTGNSFISGMLTNSSYTGAMLEQVSTQLAEFFGCPSGSGLLVRSVVDNSPAALAGMHAGDVVVRANGKSVATTSDWSKVVKGSHGHPLSVIVLRDKREQTLTLTPDPKHRSCVEELFQAPERTVMAHLNFSWLPF